MSEAVMSFPECCRYCPHKTPVKATCDADSRQALVEYFAADERRPCPVFEDERATAMADLEGRLS